MATLPPDNLSPMMPEPTTAANNIAVPTPSAVARRAKLTFTVQYLEVLECSTLTRQWLPAQLSFPSLFLHTHKAPSLANYPGALRRLPTHCHRDPAPRFCLESHSNNLFASR